MANRNKITHYNCPECKGAGEYFAEYIAEYPRYEDCGVCEGTGLLNKTEFFRWLGILSAAKSYADAHAEQYRNYN